MSKVKRADFQVPCPQCQKFLTRSNLKRHMKSCPAVKRSALTESTEPSSQDVSRPSSRGRGLESRTKKMSQQGSCSSSSSVKPSTARCPDGSSVSFRYIEKATLALLDQRDDYSKDALCNFLARCYPKIPASSRKILVVAATTAATRVAGLHALVSGSSQDPGMKKMVECAADALLCWNLGLSPSHHTGRVGQVPNVIASEESPVLNDPLNSSPHEDLLTNALIDAGLSDVIPSSGAPPGLVRSSDIVNLDDCSSDDDVDAEQTLEVRATAVDDHSETYNPPTGSTVVQPENVSNGAGAVTCLSQPLNCEPDVLLRDDAMSVVSAAAHSATTSTADCLLTDQPYLKRTSSSDDAGVSVSKRQSAVTASSSSVKCAEPTVCQLADKNVEKVNVAGSATSRVRDVADNVAVAVAADKLNVTSLPSVASTSSAKMADQSGKQPSKKPSAQPLKSTVRSAASKSRGSATKDSRQSPRHDDREERRRRPFPSIPEADWAEVRRFAEERSRSFKR